MIKKTIFKLFLTAISNNIREKTKIHLLLPLFLCKFANHLQIRKNNMDKRVSWIDLLRGICMLAILLDHTELYYTGMNIINYNAYVVNALTIFFVLSGYLMYKDKQIFDIKHKLKSIVKGLLIPYFIFTTIIALPKAFAHGNTIEFNNICTQILMGQASWFVAALCLSEFIFAIVIWITRGKLPLLFSIGVIGFCISIYLSQGNQPYPWQLDNSMQALLFLSIGYTYHRYEQFFNIFNRLSSISLLFVLLVLIKIYEYMNEVNMLIWHIDINNYLLFLLDTPLCALIMIHISKRSPRCKWLEWTGVHSLVYYFLCGGVPFIICKIFTNIGLPYNGTYLYVIVTFLLVYGITSAFTWIIYKYTPFLVGKQK